MEKPVIDKKAVYNIVADAMPLEGRDFTLDTAVGADGKPLLVINPLTDIGRAFVPTLIERLSPAMKDNGGFTVVADGHEKQEVMTVASIRANIEKEATVAREKRIKDTEEALAKARKEADEAAKSQDVDKIRSTRNAVNSAAQAEYMLKRSFTKIDEIRKSVNDNALKEADEDEKNGKSWAVDMDAPLTSLFDRQDVTEKMKMKEALIQRIAESEVALEDIKSEAASVMKQYIKPKKG